MDNANPCQETRMNAKEILKPYAGPLSLSEIVEGMNAAEHNAARLFKDAESLLSIGSYASALALAILSIEESGKVIVLRDLSTAPDVAETKRVWKEFRSHVKRTELGYFLISLGEA
jgi:AbiV family abortive infection protein